MLVGHMIENPPMDDPLDFFANSHPVLRLQFTKVKRRRDFALLFDHGFAPPWVRQRRAVRPKAQ
jgi:hypothetical protein